MSVNTDGFDDLSKKLEDMKQRAQKLQGENTVTFNELFNQGFMSEHTNGKFPTIDELVSFGGFDHMEFSDIPDAPWDKLIAEQTDCPNWDDLYKSAMQTYVQHRMGF
ncbi:hypothetical protein [Furfurilactobacillus milii]|uniref:Uncharacterized protein n=1 Tax=Furfurilactobacillus milii TaxID=2888272 RepID=A0ABT6DCI4_9LACO|nr:hypothetical protein [Furfurilactobacillus milii]QLE66928.1 RNA polymerase III [Furfurilactobacillus rossiae]MCF6161938.1 hypothetical protein [Furfurilactobacillus milii]MCF6164318.1 hypothetical protein [Furfurilactobacillus milii]MDF9914806.1 hypothetical protein [Furfurilactobacillus milii]QLE69358.1 RNA polymerase III [Furfurilactobacillus rossiae]